MKKSVEVLSPAGSMESLKAAVMAGADAVYLGGTKFGARAYADNFDEKTLMDAIDYVHLHGRKIYLTINTLLKDRELSQELYVYLLPYYKQGIDAVIVQDTGVLEFVKKYFPGLPIHASTQMTITSEAGGRFMEAQGVERVVPARELNLGEIKRLKANTNLEVECFVHGALCYGYSGQCLFSSLVGGRSGNRGQCAQPCRLPYQNSETSGNAYLLSPKDMCTLDILPDLMEAGIDSFKIEGRMKKPEYVAVVTKLYKKYVKRYLQNGKKGYTVEQKDKEMLLDIYNRGGFHVGYYKTQNGKDMMALKRPNHAGVEAILVQEQTGQKVIGKALTALHGQDVIEIPGSKDNYTLGDNPLTNGKVVLNVGRGVRLQPGTKLNRTKNEELLSAVRKEIEHTKIQEKINGKLILSSTKPAKLDIIFSDIYVSVTGDIPEKALNQPTSKERLETQLRKTGNMEFAFETLDIHMEEQLFVSMQGINDLRRRGMDELTRAIAKQYRRKEVVQETIFKKDKQSHPFPKEWHVSVETKEQFAVVVAQKEVRRIYVDANITKQFYKQPSASAYVEKGHSAGKEIYYAMPYIFRDSARKQYEEAYQSIEDSRFDGMLVRNYESYQFLMDHHYEKDIVLDYNMYQFNGYSKQFWDKQAMTTQTAPVELNVHELKELDVTAYEFVLYGYLPMMVSAQCIKKNTTGCEHQSGQLKISDRYQNEFVVKNNCDYCYNVIYNTTPLVLADMKKELLELNPTALRLMFTTENKADTETVLRWHQKVLFQEEPVGQPDGAFTRGHFKRGVK